MVKNEKKTKNKNLQRCLSKRWVKEEEAELKVKTRSKADFFSFKRKLGQFHQQHDIADNKFGLFKKCCHGFAIMSQGGITFKSGQLRALCKKWFKFLATTEQLFHLSIKQAY